MNRKEILDQLINHYVVAETGLGISRGTKINSSYISMYYVDDYRRCPIGVLLTPKVAEAIEKLTYKINIFGFKGLMTIYLNDSYEYFKLTDSEIDYLKKLTALIPTDVDIEVGIDFLTTIQNLHDNLCPKHCRQLDKRELKELKDRLVEGFILLKSRLEE